MKIERIAIPATDPRNAGITAFYPIDRAAWIWHPEALRNRRGSVLFTLAADITEEVLEFTAHISADNRYEFFIDGERIGMGPDRGDLFHWSFASYKMSLEKGKHTLSAVCHYYPAETECIMPRAQIMDKCGGFAFAVTEEALRDRFNTGTASWEVQLLASPEFDWGGWATGMCTVTDVKAQLTPGEPVEPVATQRPVPENNHCGGRNLTRVSYPSPLPEQIRRKYEKPVQVRAVFSGAPDADLKANVLITEEDTAKTEAQQTWQEWINGRKPEGITLPADTVQYVLLDFADYLCAYPVLKACGGDKESMIRIYWSESLYDDVPGKKIETLEELYNRGDRNAVAGKTFRMEFQWDVFRNFPETPQEISSMWWRAGRYVMLIIKTGTQPLTLNSLYFEESRYPLEQESEIRFDDPALESVQQMMLRVLQSCAHETFMDCPYYEQLMYVGDTRLEALTTYALTHDDRLPKRAVTLFDWSRAYWDGLVAEHFPGFSGQLSATFSMIWPLMVRDLMLYRRFENEAEFKHLRRSVRNLINVLGEYVNEDGLITGLPGWSFVDWVANSPWVCGTPGRGDNAGTTSIFTLHYTLALKAAMELEDYLPEDGGTFKAYYQQCFERSAAGVQKAFYNEKKHLFSDDLEQSIYSVHAQVLAILSEVLPQNEVENCFFSMLSEREILQPTISFIHYLFDTCHKLGFGSKILNYTNIWTDMRAKGAVTTWENPEPTRSECHAWGSHLYYHYFSTIAGIRPAAPGFTKVLIRPSFGHLTHIQGKMVHPDGWIEFDLTKQKDERVHGRIVLPENCTGKFACDGFGKLLNSGINEF